MKNILLSTVLVACVSALAACSGGGGTSNAITSSSSGGGSSSGGTITTRLDSITICSAGGANPTSCPSSAPSSDSDNSGFWNPVDVLYTSAASRAVIFLHGGGGTNYGMESDLGLNANDVPATTQNINFDWLTSNKVIAVFPQGQGNVPTWNNYVMDSGQDDVAMLQTLAAYVKSTYGVSSIYLVGHSNGGMMANRMWCESPGTFDGYVALAGPPSEHYLTTACAPNPVQPYYGIIGGLDTVTCDNGAATDADAGSQNTVEGCQQSLGQIPFSSVTFKGSSTWTINAVYQQGLGGSEFVDPTIIGEYQAQSTRATLKCQESLPAGTTDSSGLNTTWSNCSGSIVLQEVLNANHPLSDGHGLCPGGSDSCSLEVASGSGAAGSTGLLDSFIVPFLTSIGN